MDTRSTKFKYSLFTKGLCFLLASALFFSFAFLAIRSVAAIEIFGFEEYLDGKYPVFTQSYGFRTKFAEDFYHVRYLYLNNADAIDKAFEEHKDEIINAAVGSYLDQKAKIIEDELRYAVENYDDSYFYYEYTADAVVIPEISQMEPATDVEVTTTFSSTEERMTDANGEEIPRNIEAAQKILQTAKGRDFLNYEALVRDEAFNVSEFHYNTLLDISENNLTSVHLYNSDFYLDEQGIKKSLLQQYSNQWSNEKSNAESKIETSRYMLSQLKAFKYYVIDDKGNVHSNINNKPAFNEIKKNNAYIFFDGKTTALGILDEEQKKYLNQALDSTKNCEIYIYVDDELLKSSDDAYNNLWIAYIELQNTNAQSDIAIMAVSLIASVILLIAFLCLCGHKNGEEECVTAAIDKFPTDLHFILSFGCITGLTVLTGWLGILSLESTAYYNLLLTYMPWVLSALLTFSYMFFIEWLASVVRIKKSGQKFFAKMLLAKLVFATGRLLKKLWEKAKKFASIFKYKPQKMQRTVILIICGYTLGNLLFALFTMLAQMFFYEEGAALICVALAIIYNGVCLYFMLKYFKNLDKIIDASCRHEPADFEGERLPESLYLLASNLTNTNEALQEAVARAVRDEQMKTELITNVSHDLKTPLTSLISYSDLLDKCDIKDETAQKYIGVIHTQSIKLKRLIEDLIEASKVSTGNVTISATKLNLSELAMQAIAEFAPEMEKNGNEIRFSEPETPPTVFADGSKTYRILSNLLSNAKKYSASDTRVYVSVYTDKINSYFEIKNISCEPLNISANELTERFVRGDKSRTREGNGLGLSIAKDLCTLQGGSLQLFIDGDLFKAIVQLPATGNINVHEEETIENEE